MKSGLTVFDRKALLHRVMGDEDLAVEIIQGFLEDMPIQIETLKAAVSKSDAHKAGGQAHKIKGAAANIGAQRLQATAYAVEKAGKNGDLQTLDTLMPQLEQRFEQASKAMVGGASDQVAL